MEGCSAVFGASLDRNARWCKTRSIQRLRICYPVNAMVAPDSPCADPLPCSKRCGVKDLAGGGVEAVGGSWGSKMRDSPIVVVIVRGMPS